MLKKMLPSMADMMTHVGSAVAGLMVIYTIIQIYFVCELRVLIFACYEKFIDFVYPWIQITFPECYSDGFERSKAFSAIERYLNSNSTKQAKRLQANVSGESEVIVLNVVNSEKVTDEFKGIKVWWTSSQNAPKQSISLYPREDEKRYFKLTFYRKHREIITSQYLKHVLDEGKAITLRERQLRLYTNKGSGRLWSHVAFDHPATFDTLAMDPDKKQEIINDLLHFSKSKDYYKKLGRVWKRSYLLYGPPGTGKSTMIAAMANLMRYDVYDIELTVIQDNTELRKLLMQTSSKSIIVIEDIDCSLDVTRQREKKEKQDKKKDEETEDPMKEMEANKSGKLTLLSGLLNFIDGLWSTCGDERIIIFTTTNYVEKLDPALIRRGRMDKHIEFSYCRFEAFKALAKNYLGIDSHLLFATIRRLLEETNMTPADVADNLMLKSVDEDVDTNLMRLVRALKDAKEETSLKGEEEEKKNAEILAKEEEVKLNAAKEEEVKLNAAKEEEEKLTAAKEEEEKKAKEKENGAEISSGDQNLANEVKEKESIHSRPAPSSPASGGNTGANFEYDMNEKNFCLTSNQNTMTEEGVARSAESYLQELDLGLDNKRYLKDFILFCSIFPTDCEFTKDILIWQWIAGGLIKLAEDEIMEEVCIRCFDTLLSADYIVASRYDCFVDQMKYKIGDMMTTFLQKQLLEPKFRKYLDSKQNDVAKVEHLSLAYEEIDGMKFGVLKRYSHLQTLVIHHCYGSKVKHPPFDLFSELKVLKILSLSRTNIVQLPSSIENLKELRYLDMSETPISLLPETICCFSNLQTLKLDGCLSLGELPKGTNKLINLRHLVLDVVRQLQSMPSGIGKLSKLRSLSAFLVGEDDGCRIGELKDMKELRGSFRILNLENVTTGEEAAEACLCNKHDLTKIELQWSDFQDEKNPDEEEILESLQPPFGIQELKILYYSGGVLPSWICNPLFGELVRIILYKCRYCCSLLSLGELPSLKHLSIVENNEVTEINSFFCRKQSNQHHVAFPKLEKLLFDSMSKLEKWTGLEDSDFPSLRHLIIKYCPKFVGFPVLSNLNSLLHVEISYCPELSFFPENLLPSKLESLMIKESPKLKDRCCSE